MRIRTMAALGFATASVAAGLAIGGAAYAGGAEPGTQVEYRIVQDDGGTSTAGYAPEDCPEKDGAGPGDGSTAPPESF